MQSGLCFYAFLELGFLLLFPQADWNSNTYAARTITAGAIGFYILPKTYLKYAFFAVSIFIAITVQCRTALVAVIFGFAFTKYVNLDGKQTQLTTGLLLISCLFASLFSQELNSAGKNYLKSSLGNQSKISKLFLSDKSTEDIDRDMFDRKQHWHEAIGAIKKHPFLGVGFGNEFTLLNKSTHNSYFTIALKSGVIGLVFWVIFYTQIVKDILTSKDTLTRQLRNLGSFFFGYLCIAGLFESSGFGSINTPMNLLLLLIAFWFSVQSNATR